MSMSIRAQETAEFQWSDLSDNTLVGLQNPKLVFPKTSGYTVYSVEALGSQFYAPKIIYISKFDSSSNKISTLEFILPKRLQKDATLLEVIEGNGKLYFFSHVALKKDGKNVLYAQIYDDANGSVSEPYELYNIPIEKVNNSGFFQISVSPDKSKFGVLVNLPFVKKSNETIAVLVFDEGLTNVSQVNQTLSFKGQRAYNEAMSVDDIGVVTIVKKTDLSKKEPVTTLINFSEEDYFEQKISSEGFYISDTRTLTINDIQYLIGFATDNAKPVVSVGGAKDNSYFLYNISDRKLIKRQNWSKETIKRVLGKGYIDLKLKDLLFVDDKIYLVGDCYSVDAKEIEGQNFKYNYTHRFGPGVVIKLNTNGDVFFESALSYGEDYLNNRSLLGSFFSFLKDGNLYILANEKESVLKDKKIVFGHDKINAKAIVLKSFDADGNINTLPFWNSKVGGAKNVTTFAPTQTIQLSNTEFYIYATGNKYHKFGKITLK